VKINWITVIGLPRMQSDTPNTDRQASCPNCWKALPLCLCDSITAFPSKTRLLVLQHPREAKNPLSTARLLSLTLPNTVHRVGLSWASLNAALGEKVESKQWAVLFLGPLKDAKRLKEDVPFQVVARGGKTVSLDSVAGIVLLDGNWKQSKTLWWRNPWLLKLHRVILNPDMPSLYGEIRKEPRKHALSTIEAAAESLQALGEKPEIANGRIL